MKIIVEFIAFLAPGDGTLSQQKAGYTLLMS
jgi:hypothetical protein